MCAACTRLHINLLCVADQDGIPMTIFVTMALAFLVVAAAVGLMSIGVISGRKPISGSCGGLNGQACILCSNTCKHPKGVEK